jgi:hypothetical protein
MEEGEGDDEEEAEEEEASSDDEEKEGAVSDSSDDEEEGAVSDSSVSDSSEEEEGGAVTASSDVEEEEEAITAGTKRSLEPCDGESCALAPPPTGYYCVCVMLLCIIMIDFICCRTQDQKATSKAAMEHRYRAAVDRWWGCG